jgi:cytochrome P450
MQFIVAALFAGQRNSGINAAWFFVYLATNADWYARVQGEVDASLKKHRTSSDQSSADILATLTIDEWESEFPMIELCLRECIRFNLVGASFRKNISGSDLAIGDTGEVVPKNSFAVSLMQTKVVCQYLGVRVLIAVYSGLPHGSSSL